MIDCLILGDSIAVGTQRFYNECAIVGKGGINSWQFNKNYEGIFKSKVVIISLGSNDHFGVRTKNELQKVRDRVDPTAKVFWIMPAIKPHVQDIVKLIAEEHDDKIIYINHLQPDKIHPSWNGYKDIVNQVKNGN